MIRAYDGALKAYIESVPMPETKMEERKTSGGIWSGYRNLSARKALCRWRAMILAAQQHT